MLGCMTLPFVVFIFFKVMVRKSITKTIYAGFVHHNKRKFKKSKAEGVYGVLMRMWAISIHRH